MTKVVILSGNHLCHNPRVLKEADALCEHGFEVVVLGAVISEPLSKRDIALMKNRQWSFIPVINLDSSKIRNIILRLRKKIGKVLLNKINIETSWMLGYATPELLSIALNHKADLYIAHSEQAMWVANRLMKRGFNVGIDMEDWYSEDLTAEAREKRPLKLLKTLESNLLASCKHVTQ